MNVACPECSSVFSVDPLKVPAGGVRARCSVCGGIISLAGEASPAPAAATVSPDPAREVGAVAGGGLRSLVPTQPEAPSRPTPEGVDLDPYAPREPAVGGEVRPDDAIGILGTASAAEVPAAYTPQPTPPGRRPINPFLNNDPGMKAKRLARALVSDMITYQPQKREEGLRNNTLKQLFREEIKKSYEEYVEQVGRDVAESTAHFQDALNDILANGRKVF